MWKMLKEIHHQSQKRSWLYKLRDVTAIGAILFFVYAIGFAVLNFDPLHVSEGVERVHRHIPLLFETGLFFYLFLSGWWRWRRYKKNAREVEMVLAVELWALSAITLILIVL